MQNPKEIYNPSSGAARTLDNGFAPTASSNPQFNYAQF